ncbi:MAG: NADH-quinone oxidoreductase subunit N [Flavobacteriales bacterium]|nr:NADH-quinone oxidoreductase subunit N [Flavobacteriales bacterium]
MSVLILLSVLGVVLLYIGLSGAGSRAGASSILAPIGVLGVAGAVALLLRDVYISIPDFAHMLAFNDMSRWFSVGILVITGLIFLFGLDYYAKEEKNVAEQFALIAFSLVGAVMLTSYTNLLSLFLGIEVLSIPLYILAGGKRHSFRSSEASFKYFLMGSFASAFLLMGIALIYGVCASFELSRITEVAATSGGNILFILGGFFVLVGLTFKVAAVPFHFWSPDVYEGAPTLVTAYMATVVKMAAFAGLLRFVSMSGMPQVIGYALVMIAAVTLLLGNIIALRQSHFKRLMAYSSVAHSGFLIMAVVSGTPDRESAIFYYTFTYSLATLGLFMVMTLAKRASNGDEHIRIFRGLFRANPWIGVVVLLLLLSLAGIPLTAGFMAKFKVFQLALAVGHVKLTVLAVAMALVGIYYYAVVIREAFSPSEQAPVLVVSPVNLLVISLCGIAVVVLGVMPQWVL